MKNTLTFTLCLSTLSCTEGLSKWRSCFPEEESGRGGVVESGRFRVVNRVVFPGFLIALMFFASFRGQDRCDVRTPHLMA